MKVYVICYLGYGDHDPRVWGVYASEKTAKRVYQRLVDTTCWSVRLERKVVYGKRKAS